MGSTDTVGRQPDAFDAGGPHDLRLSGDGRPVGQPGVKCQGRRRHGHDLATDRQDPVDPPDAVLEVAALDGGHRSDQQIAEGVTGQALGVAPLARGKAVLEDVAHQRLRIGECGDAVADIADWWDPQPCPEDTRRPAIVGDRHDRGEIARVLLEPPQQRRQPGPAADRDDPWPASQEPLLVDDLHQRLIGAGPPQRVGEDVGDPVCAEKDQQDSDRCGRESAHCERQELEGQQVDDGTGGAGRLEVARDLTKEMGERDGEQHHPGEPDQHPPLDPDTGRQPAAELHFRSSSRWKTATGP